MTRPSRPARPRVSFCCKMKKHKKLRIFLLALAVYLVYAIAGALLPFTVHPEVNDGFQSAFDAAVFYGEGATDRATLVVGNDEALDVRVRMINEARERIVFTNFDIRDCESSRDIFAALLAAAERGVEIQILTDGMNGLVSTSRSPTFVALGRLPNVEFRFYNVPNPLLPWTFNGRLHDKYIIVDDRLLLIGGRNTFDKFIGNYVPQREKSHDLEVLIYNGGGDTSNSVISQVEDYFNGVWNLPYTKPHLERDYVFSLGSDRAAEGLRERYAQWQAARPELFEGEVDYVGLTVPLDSVTMITNPTHILSKEPLVWWQTQQLMERATERVILQTPYAVCNEAMYAGLARVAAKGIPFDMQINAVGVGDNFMASSDYIHNKDKVLSTGATVWEWYGDYSSHGKSVLIDDNLSVVGSLNLDMRSVYIDTEMMFVFHGEEFNRVLEDYLMEMEAESLQVTGAETYAKKPGVEPWDNGDWKHGLFPVTSVLFQPFRFLL